MNPSRRVFVQFVAGHAALLRYAGSAGAQGYPTHPVRVVVPFPPGGVNDILARIVADKLQAKWGQPVVIENKTGAGGNIGAEFVYQAAPDGYTLMAAPAPPLAVNQNLYKHLAYKPEEFVPMTVIGSVPNVVIARKDLPPNSLSELIAHIRERPGKVSFGSQGSGATPHLTGMMFQAMTGTQIIHVPYRGETLVLNDIVGGHIDLFFGNVAAVKSLYRDGKVKVLATADAARSPDLPEVPTTAEAGLPGLVSTGWFALVGPPKLAPSMQAGIADAVIDVLNMPDVREKLRALSVTAGGQSPAETAAFIRRESERWGAVIKKFDIVVD
ncbi:MAG TPA: tripartite tricarboxylate transporter substrate binding protein [Xanthobacteraceae bacterium]|jgi:tripartite-type tricarboxylate transporter receptor subunit TctC